MKRRERRRQVVGNSHIMVSLDIILPMHFFASFVGVWRKTDDVMWMVGSRRVQMHSLLGFHSLYMGVLLL